MKGGPADWIAKLNQLLDMGTLSRQDQSFIEYCERNIQRGIALTAPEWARIYRLLDELGM